MDNLRAMNWWWNPKADIGERGRFVTVRSVSDLMAGELCALCLGLDFFGKASELLK